MTDLWVFGYGSLMWRPGFPYVGGRWRGLSARIARFASIPGCIAARRSGPGLVLGLDRGGDCRGIAFRVAAKERDAVIAYLREREQVTAVYLERMRPIRFADGARRARSPISSTAATGNMPASSTRRRSSAWSPEPGGSRAPTATT